MTRLIDADEIKYTDMLFSTGNGNYEHVGMVTQYEIDALPTVDAVPVRHGKWMPLPYDSGGYWQCSDCVTPTEASGANVIYKYCPFCGAKMDGAERKEE